MYVLVYISKNTLFYMFLLQPVIKKNILVEINDLEVLRAATCITKMTQKIVKWKKILDSVLCS